MKRYVFELANDLLKTYKHRLPESDQQRINRAVEAYSKNLITSFEAVKTIMDTLYNKEV